MLTTHSSRQVALSSMPSSWTRQPSARAICERRAGDDVLNLLQCQVSAGVFCFARSRRHHHFADHLAVLDQSKPFARLFERQHLVDHGLDLALLDISINATRLSL